MKIESIQVGKPRDIDKNWTTAIYKSTVPGPVYLGEQNLDGDQQADLSVHGGPDKAVNVYPIEHYRYWNQRARLGVFRRINLPKQINGSFGENFTISGLVESEACIGDIFKIGEALVQISQPRQPCWKLARKFKQPKLPFWVQQTSKSGWYFRVLETGNVSAGNSLKRIDQPFPQWTIVTANQLMYAPNKNKDQLQQISECEALSESWKSHLKSICKQ